MNFKNFGNDPSLDNGSSGRSVGNFPLTRQSSIYSLTFDELMSTGGISKDFGSMNMDELLKTIWTAEELQSVAAGSDGQGGTTAIVGGTSGFVPGGNLQRQGSLSLPRTLSQKTVDEVWRDIYKEYNEGKDGGAVGGGSNFPQREQTLGEMTLEEFLARAGVVREDNQLAAKPNIDIFSDLSSQGQVNNNGGFDLGSQQLSKSNELTGHPIHVMGSNNQMSIRSSTDLPLNVNGIRTSQQHRPLQHAQPPQQSQHQQRQQQIFPKQPAVAFATQMASPNMAQLSSPGARNGILGIGDQGLSSGLIQGSTSQGGGMGIVGMGPASVTVATLSPTNPLSSDGNGKNNGDTSSVSPVPYMFNGGLRGRRSNAAVEKVVERRQRRMIKNRESAARSRARKQAYTMELEAEVAKLKEENEELRKKQEEIVAMQKNQVMEMMNMQHGVKKRCLRRTQTGSW